MPVPEIVVVRLTEGVDVGASPSRVSDILVECRCPLRCCAAKVPLMEDRGRDGSTEVDGFEVCDVALDLDGGRANVPVPL